MTQETDGVGTGSVSKYTSGPKNQTDSSLNFPFWDTVFAVEIRKKSLFFFLGLDSWWFLFEGLSVVFLQY